MNLCLQAFHCLMFNVKSDEEEERKKKEMKEAARKELEDWYKHHKEAIEKTRSANRFVLFLYTYFSCLSNALSISSFNATYNL